MLRRALIARAWRHEGGLTVSGSTPALLVRGSPADASSDQDGATRTPVRRWQASKGLLRLISPVAVLLLWQLESNLGLLSAQKLPPPTEIWRTAVSLITTDSPAYGTLQGAMLVSLERVAVGFGLGAAVAVSLAVLAG